ncbi:hypothetical protein HYC85_012753 [Camellia sinensis]|uniref:NAB domain-containing protein n=1 Tax=Camellia sinensis TaxID=4442 RepID=A0A7J7HCW6_CAMSI|nr:hypothetical protein HYC85_012753 [Camellia sinensis]
MTGEGLQISSVKLRHLGNRGNVISVEVSNPSYAFADGIKGQLRGTWAGQSWTECVPPRTVQKPLGQGVTGQTRMLGPRMVETRQTERPAPGKARPESRRLYSWWWDSHISPKNSKWLQENLTDMDEKVKAMIKLIEEDADSFARRAEMFYKKRPELMKLVEEFYRAYRALAERYHSATGELRQAHRTMAKAFPDQVPLELTEDSLSGSSSVHDQDHSICALLDPDDLHKDVLERIGHGPCSRESDTRIGKKGLELPNDVFGAGIALENSKLAEGTMRLEVEEKGKGLEESKLAGGAETENQNLNEVDADRHAKKEAVLLQYQQSMEKLSNLERELNRAQMNYSGIDVQASKAANEVQTLKEALVKLEAEKDAGFHQHKDYLKRISNLESRISQAQEDEKGLHERAIRAEIQAQYLEKDLSRLETEKDDGLLQYNHVPRENL